MNGKVLKVKDGSGTLGYFVFLSDGNSIIFSKDADVAILRKSDRPDLIQAIKENVAIKDDAEVYKRLADAYAQISVTLLSVRAVDEQGIKAFIDWAYSLTKNHKLLMIKKELFDETA